MGTNRWTPVLIHTARVKCEITLMKVWKPDNMETGLYLKFQVYPNLNFTGTDVPMETWKRKVYEFVSRKAATLTGLRKKDFFDVGWGVGPSIIIGTAKQPKLQVTT